GEKSEPGEVRVRVMNGGAPAGSAQQELAYLQTDAGVTKSENAGNAPEEADKTTLEYDSDQADQARALAEILGLSGAAMNPGESVTNSQGLPTMTLTLGKDFKGAGVKIGSSSVKKPDLDTESTADQKQCAS
ncbi:LytR C-terminal domain-containing protein, partial [Streptomyces olivaceus]